MYLGKKPKLTSLQLATCAALFFVQPLHAQVQARATGTLVDLALLPPVMKELRLQEDSSEVVQMRSLNERLGKETQEARSKLIRLDASARDDAMQKLQIELRAKSDPKLEKLLTPDQYRRLKQIRLQIQGSHALAEPDVQSSLGIDSHQKDKIAAALKDYTREFQELHRPDRPAGDATERQQKVADLANQLAKSIGDVLSADQKAKLDELKGKRFEMAPPEGSRPRGLRGRSGTASRDIPQERQSDESKD